MTKADATTPILELSGIGKEFGAIRALHDVDMMYFSWPSVSEPGKSGAGNRVPVASNHIEEGPGRMRMPCRGQIGDQFWMPST